MKTTWRILKVLFVAFLVLVYTNIGFHFGEAVYRAEVKFANGEKTNILEGFLYGPNGWGHDKDIGKIEKRHSTTTWILVFIWPLYLILYTGAWIVQGAIRSGIAIWHGLLFLFKFTLRGGFFSLIGPAGVALIIVFIVAVFIRMRLRIRRRTAAKKE